MPAIVFPGKIGADRHRPYANIFPEGDELLKEARSMGTHYSTSSRWGGLVALRKSAGMASKLSGTRIKVRVEKPCLVQYELAINLINAVVDNTRDLRQMPKNDTRITAEYAFLMSEARINRVVKVDCEISKHEWTLSDDEWHSHAEFEGILHITQIASTQAQEYERLLLGAYSCILR